MYVSRLANKMSGNGKKIIPQIPKWCLKCQQHIVDHNMTTDKKKMLTFGKLEPANVWHFFNLNNWILTNWTAVFQGSLLVQFVLLILTNTYCEN